MTLRIHLAILCLAVSSTAGALAQAAPAAGCKVSKGYYHCNPVAFVEVFNQAKTVAIETQPFDRIAAKALSDFAKSLGKTTTSDAADLTFVLIRTDATGIVYGPSDGELASLSVYSRGADSGRGKLIWIEAYYGQPDLAWPAVVHLTIEQFKVDIK